MSFNNNKGILQSICHFFGNKQSSKKKKKGYFVIGTLVFRCFVPLANDVITNGSDGCLSLC